ncbi:LLM class flavin-dependent oxidoreductase [Phytoactinopolyspora alkaliphila]|uniref:LLM class flavin-dependent oxidoreductase n=1 Tax=Phytoactinopolyspora alkaliphila TaxID=1783498 RepID=UPI001C205769
MFPVPIAAEHADLLRQVQLAEHLGLDLVGVQDHPYQRRYLDTFTLLPWLAARTDRIRFFPDVAHMPLRPPAMLAKAIASLDVLSGGRIELGLGAGAYPEASQAMGAPVRQPRESVAAVEEAISIIRRFWESPRQAIHHRGRHFELGGVKAGPPPAHDIGIWVGGDGPRMLRVVASMADGWISPGTRHLTFGGLLAKRDELDRYAADADRDPATIRRLTDVSGTITDGPTSSWLHGPVDHWVDELKALAAAGFDTFIFWPDEATDEQIHAFAEVAGQLRGG